MSSDRRRGQTYDEWLSEQMDFADCETFVDGNGEVQRSSSGPDLIGEALPSSRPGPRPVGEEEQQPNQQEYDEF